MKLTSPNLNYVLLLGVTLMALSGLAYPSTEHIVNVIDCMVSQINTRSLSCSLHVYLNTMQNSRVFATLGYDICIAIAMVKTWRVYYIFKNPSPNKKASEMLIALCSWMLNSMPCNSHAFNCIWHFWYTLVSQGLAAATGSTPYCCCRSHISCTITGTEFAQQWHCPTTKHKKGAFSQCEWGSFDLPMLTWLCYCRIKVFWRISLRKDVTNPSSSPCLSVWQ